MAVLYPLSDIHTYSKKIRQTEKIRFYIALGTFIGFLSSVIGTFIDHNAAYYLLPTRAWEMMIGGVAYLYPVAISDERKRAVEWLGLALIVSSFVLVTKENQWPGYFALIPVIGTYLLLQSNRSGSLITGNILCQKIGACSYSIYLWHWPIVVAIHYFQLSDIYNYFGITLSIGLGLISYRYVESIKFQMNVFSVFGLLRCKPIFMIFFIGLIGGLIYVQDGVGNKIRLDDQALLLSKSMNQNPKNLICGKVIDGVSPGCIYGEKEEIKAIVIGDSHAQAMVEGLGHYVAKHYNGSILDWSMSSCNTIKGLYIKTNSGNNYNCGLLVEKSINKVRKDFKGVPIVIINRTSQNLYGMQEREESKPNSFVDMEFETRNDAYRQNLVRHMVDTICEFTESNPVYLVRPIPELVANVPKTQFKELLFGNTTRVSIPIKDYYKRQHLAYSMQDEAVERCGAKILDPIPYLCGNEECFGDKDGKPLYFDDDHLNLFGTKLISPIFGSVFQSK